MRGWVEQMTAIMMHVVRYHQFGGPEVLKWSRCHVLTQRRMKYLFASCSGFLDWKIRQGRMPMPVRFPVIPGSAFAGVIESVGKNVTEFATGQEVFGRSSIGSYAEYTIASKDAIALKPASIRFDEASNDCMASVIP
jgi:NADPH:quinone reductase-like Zn-dependent oxidoreductase